MTQRSQPAGKQPEEKKMPHRSTEAYIDTVEEGVARILLKDSSGEWRGHALPATILPQGVKEGDWLRLTVEKIPAKDTVAKTPSSGGGTIKL